MGFLATERAALHRRATEIARHCHLRHGRVPARVREILLATAPAPNSDLKYDPHQPRIPAGQPDGGQWADGGGGGGALRPLQLPRQPSLRRPLSHGGLHARSDRARETTIYHPDGSQEIRKGGSISWRNNNPGNLRPGSRGFNEWVEAIGQTSGKEGVFLVFKDEPSGKAAFKKLLRGRGYRDLSLNAAMDRYKAGTDKGELENAKKLIRAEGDFTGLEIIGELTEKQMESLFVAVRKSEQWDVGVVTRIRP